MSTRNDGGPAFPEIKTDWPSSNYHDTHSVGGMTLRDYFVAHAPTEEVGAIIPETIKDLEKWLNVDSYDYRVHYPMALAKARRIWADTMLKAREE